MKTIIYILVILSFTACSDNNAEALKEEIAAKKQEINKINKEIAELENKLSEIDTVQKNVFRTIIDVKELESEEFNHYIRVNGRVEAVREAWISPEINGQIKNIHIEEGDNVAAGRLLVSLNTEVTRRNIEEVKTNLNLARELYEKQKELWDQKVGTEVQYLQAKNNVESLEARLATLEEQLSMATIRAPFGGIVEEIMVKEGELAMPGSPMIHLVNPQQLRITAHLSENYIQSIRQGEEVQLSFPLYEDLNLEVPVTRVGSVIDNDARTFEMEIELRNPGGRLKPNQLANMLINDYHADSALVVPTIAIKQDVSGYYLYKITENEEGTPEADKVYVTPGRAYEDMTMIVKGLEPGMKIITEGYNLVQDGTEVRIKK